MEIGIMASGMITLSPVLFMQWVRMVFGPMPQWFCWFLSLWRNCPTQCTLMFLDALVLFRVTINFDSKTPTIFKNTSFFSVLLYFRFQRHHSYRWRFLSHGLLYQYTSLVSALWSSFHDYSRKIPYQLLHVHGTGSHHWSLHCFQVPYQCHSSIIIFAFIRGTQLEDLEV